MVMFYLSLLLISVSQAAPSSASITLTQEQLQELNRSAHLLVRDRRIADINTSSLKSLKNVALVLEVDETDDEADVTLRLETEKGLTTIQLFDPDGRAILDLNAGGSPGLHELSLESGESGVDEIMEAYPEGEYLVLAQSVTGRWWVGAVSMSFDWIVAPKPTVSIGSEVTTISWMGDAGAVGYELEIESEDEEIGLEIKLEANRREVIIHNSMLMTGMEYELTLSVISANGNVSEREIELEIPD